MMNVADDGSVSYLRKDGGPLTSESEKAAEKFLFLVDALERSIIASGGRASPREHGCMMLQMAGDLLGMSWGK